MTLSEKQRKFTKKIGQLILWAYENGYELTFGDAWAQTGHMKDSLHYSRLAVDFNLFKDGKWLTKSEAHRPLGKFWESLAEDDFAPIWGGRFKDGNHYSVKHEGRA